MRYVGGCWLWYRVGGDMDMIKSSGAVVMVLYKVIR
jgi:hypothetical protein